MRRLPALVAGLALLVACNGQAEPEGVQEAAPSPTPPASPAEAAAEPDPPPGPEVPRQLDFTLPELGGGQVVGAELAGQALALWFWTPW